jgi:hypothetical protein
LSDTKVVSRSVPGGVITDACGAVADVLHKSVIPSQTKTCKIGENLQAVIAFPPRFCGRCCGRSGCCGCSGG